MLTCNIRDACGVLYQYLLYLMDWLTFIALKLNISFILHVLRFEGIISAINGMTDLEGLVQINRHVRWCLNWIYHLVPSNFPFFFATRPYTAAEVMTFLFIKGHC